MNSHSQTIKKEEIVVSKMEKKMNKRIKKGTIIPREEKKEWIDKEEIQLHKDLDQLTNWITLVDSMNDEKLKEYLHDRPQELKILKIPKCNPNPNPNPKRNGQRVENPKYWASYGIMASVWKFHKQDKDQQLS